MKVSSQADRDEIQRLETEIERLKARQDGKMLVTPMFIDTEIKERTAELSETIERLKGELEEARAWEDQKNDYQGQLNVAARAIPDPYREHLDDDGGPNLSLCIVDMAVGNAALVETLTFLKVNVVEAIWPEPESRGATITAGLHKAETALAANETGAIGEFLAAALDVLEAYEPFGDVGNSPRATTALICLRQKAKAVGW